MHFTNFQLLFGIDINDFLVLNTYCTAINIPPLPPNIFPEELEWYVPNAESEWLVIK
jgi:hypothetical protein